MSENSFKSSENIDLAGVEATPPLPTRSTSHPPDNGVERETGIYDIPDASSRVVVVCNRKPPPMLKELGARHGADHVRLRAWALDFEGYILESRNQDMKAATSGLFSVEVVEQIKSFSMESLAADQVVQSYADATKWWRECTGADLLVLFEDYFRLNESGASSEGQRIQDVKTILNSLPSARSVLPTATEYHQRHLLMDANKLLVQLPSLIENRYPGCWKLGVLVSDELVKAFLDKFPPHFRAVVQRKVVGDLQSKRIIGNKADMFLYHAQAQSFMWKLNAFFGTVDTDIYAPLTALIDGLGTELVQCRSEPRKVPVPGGKTPSTPTPKAANAQGKVAGSQGAPVGDGTGCFRCGKRECSRGSDMRTACLMRADSSFSAEESALGRANKKAFFALRKAPKKP